MVDLFVMSRGRSDDYRWRRPDQPGSTVTCHLPPAWQPHRLIDSGWPWIVLGRDAGRLWLSIGGLPSTRTDMFNRVILNALVFQAGQDAAAWLRALAASVLADRRGFSELVDQAVVASTDTHGWSAESLDALLRSAIAPASAGTALDDLAPVRWDILKENGAAPSAATDWQQRVAMELLSHDLPTLDGLFVLYSHNGDPLAMEALGVYRAFTLVHAYHRSSGSLLDAASFAMDLAERRAANSLAETEFDATVSVKPRRGGLLAVVLDLFSRENSGRPPYPP